MPRFCHKTYTGEISLKTALSFCRKKVSAPFVKQGNAQLQAVLKLMPIIGLASEAALRNYLREIGVILPKNYGEDYTLVF